MKTFERIIQEGRKAKTTPKKKAPPIHTPSAKDGVFLRDPAFGKMQDPKRPVVLIDLQGGVVHRVLASEELHDVLFVFSGDAEDCRSENKLVTLNPEFADFVYAVNEVDGKLTPLEEKFIIKKAKTYARSR